MYFAAREDAGFSAIVADEARARAWVADMLTRFPMHRFVIGPVTASAGVTISPPSWTIEGEAK